MVKSPLTNVRLENLLEDIASIYFMDIETLMKFPHAKAVPGQEGGSDPLKRRALVYS